MSLDKTIRENTEGKYLIIYANNLEEGIDYALKKKVDDIQIWGRYGQENIGAKIDFNLFEKIAGQLKILSLSDTLENVINPEGIYFLKNLERLYLSSKQKFKIDLTRFPKLTDLGGEYWRGLLNLNKAISLETAVLIKLPYMDLKELSELKNLQTLHVYRSKTQSLKGIEKLPLEELTLARNRYLEDIEAIRELKSLKSLFIEKCKNIKDWELVKSLEDKIQVSVLN